jgi:hypothetical protein
MESALHVSVPGTGTGTFTTLHNTVYTQNLTYLITQGTAQSNRQGDSVYLCSLKASGLHQGPVSLQDGLVFRILVYWADQFQNTGAVTSVTISAPDLFIARNKFEATGIVDPKKIYVIHDELVEVQPSISNVYTGTQFNLQCLVNKAIHFIPGTNEVNPRQLYISIIPSIANGNPGVSTTGEFSLSTDLVFKNSK